MFPLSVSKSWWSTAVSRAWHSSRYGLPLAPDGHPNQDCYVSVLTTGLARRIVYCRSLRRHKAATRLERLFNGSGHLFAARYRVLVVLNWPMWNMLTACGGLGVYMARGNAIVESGSNAAYMDHWKLKVRDAGCCQ
jgi:hypothetical protein